MSIIKCRMQNAECRVSVTFLAKLEKFLIKIISEQSEEIFHHSALCTLNFALCPLPFALLY